MDRKQLNMYLCAILTTLDEVPGGWSPRTHIMLGCKLDLETYHFIERVLVQADLVTTTSDVITISLKGRELAKKVMEATKKV